MARLQLLLAVALVATAALAPAAEPVAAAGAERPSGVALSPALVELDLSSDAVELPFTVANNEVFPVRVRAQVLAVRQQLDGTLHYEGGVEGLAALPGDLVLEPGERQQVRVTGSLGGTARYAGLVVEPRRADVRAAGVGAVETRTRLAAPLLLRGPGPHREAVEVTDVTLTPTDQERVFRVGALLRNTGDVHVRPRGTVTIRHPDGRDLGTADLPGTVLLPGAVRALDGGLWTAPAAAKTVDLEAVVEQPAASARRTVRLDGTGPAPDGAGGDRPAAPAEPTGAAPGSGNPARPEWPVWTAGGLLAVMAALLLQQVTRRQAPGAPAR